jgi:uncharacterized MAPEG superfamily protein
MTVADWCLLGAVLLYLLTVAPVKALRARQFNNSRPRDSAFYVGKLSERALGAHLNGIEVFPFFAVAVVLAEMRHAPQPLVDELAVAFLILRFAYVLAYLGDRPTTRTILWNMGFLANVAIFILPTVGNYPWMPRIF